MLFRPISRSFDYLLLTVLFVIASVPMRTVSFLSIYLLNTSNQFLLFRLTFDAQTETLDDVVARNLFKILIPHSLFIKPTWKGGKIKVSDRFPREQSYWASLLVVGEVMIVEIARRFKSYCRLNENISSKVDLNWCVIREADELPVQRRPVRIRGIFWATLTRSNYSVLLLTVFSLHDLKIHSSIAWCNLSSKL